MDDETQTEPLDPNLQLPRDVYYQLIHTFSVSVPPPITGSPEDPARRDNAATADEARLAAQYVAADAEAMVCLRLARRYHGDPNFIRRCSAQSAGMMRQSRAARTLLLRVRAERRKLERRLDRALRPRADGTDVGPRPFRGGPPAADLLRVIFAGNGTTRRALDTQAADGFESAHAHQDTVAAGASHSSEPSQGTSLFARTHPCLQIQP
jgi:hypothetical protein